MKNRVKPDRPIYVSDLIHKVCDYLEDTSIFTGHVYSVTFVNYNRHLRVCDVTADRTLYHPVKSVQDASNALAFYDGYAQAIYDIYNVIENPSKG